MCLDAIVLEALQDGSVNIPEVLQPYMMGMKVLLVGLCELEENSKVLSQGRLEAKKGSHIFCFFLTGYGKEPGQLVSLKIWI